MVAQNREESLLLRNILKLRNRIQKVIENVRLILIVKLGSPHSYVLNSIRFRTLNDDMIFTKIKLSVLTK